MFFGRPRHAPAIDQKSYQKIKGVIVVILSHGDGVIAN